MFVPCIDVALLCSTDLFPPGEVHHVPWPNRSAPVRKGIFLGGERLEMFVCLFRRYWEIHDIQDLKKTISGQKKLVQCLDKFGKA